MRVSRDTQPSRCSICTFTHMPCWCHPKTISSGLRGTAIRILWRQFWPVWSIYLHKAIWKPKEWIVNTNECIPKGKVDLTLWGMSLILIFLIFSRYSLKNQNFSRYLFFWKNALPVQHVFSRYVSYFLFPSEIREANWSRGLKSTCEIV